MRNNEPIPLDWEPEDNSVVIGKGKRYYYHPGNSWLRKIVASMLDDYAVAKSKLDKSLIISDVVDLVRQNGSFVKKSSSGTWVHAEELLCREKISAVFRDAMHQRGRTSISSQSQGVSNKQARQRRQRQPPSRQEQQEMGEQKGDRPPPEPKTLPFDANALGSTTHGAQFFNGNFKDTKKDASPVHKVGEKMLELSDSSFLPEADRETRKEGTAMIRDGEMLSIFSRELLIDEKSNPFEPKPIYESVEESHEVLLFSRRKF
jgi:hypothetical protein